MMRIKRIFLFIFILFTVGDVCAQDTIEYIVQRGETIELLAERCRVTKEQILELNPEVDFWATGMTILLPVGESNKKLNIGDEYLIKFGDDLLDAMILLGQRNYRKAIKAFDQMERTRKKGGYGSEEQDWTTLYYCRGLSHYSLQHYRKSQHDFEVALSYASEGDDRIEKMRNFIASAQRQRDAIHERNASIFAGLVTTAATATAAYMDAKNSNSVKNGRVSSNSSYSNTSSDETSSIVQSSSSHDSRKICRTCKGDGKCIGCHGSGYRTDNSFGTGVDYGHECGVCGGDGKCNICGGEGKK